MSQKTKIEWTDTTWNPLRGCSRVSAGCVHCYAETMARRYAGPGLPYEGLATAKGWTGEVRLVEEHLADPLRWRRPRRVFVNSMSDLFHEKVPDEWIDRIFAVMALAPRHTFQILTKRPERMRRYMIAGSPGKIAPRHEIVACEADDIRHDSHRGQIDVDALRRGDGWPLPNVWLGVSVEDQRTADARIPLLLSTPAAVRFVSYEPALGPVDFVRLSPRDEWEVNALRGEAWGTAQHVGLPPQPIGARLDWIIVGGESGPGARPFDVAWARSTIAACRAAGVACFVKQLGARPIGVGPLGGSGKVTDRKGGDPAEWSPDLRVREFPR